MRLIGRLDNEKKAFVFYSFLLSEGIHSTYETVFDEQEKRNIVSIWIYEEDEITRASQYLEEFKKNESDPKFAKVEFPTAPPQPPDLIAENKEEHAKNWKGVVPVRQRKKRSYPVTYLVIFVCVFLFGLGMIEKFAMIREDGALAVGGWTFTQQLLMFDYPKSAQEFDAFLKEYALKDYKEPKDIPAQELSQLKKIQQIPTWRGILGKGLQYFGRIPREDSIDGPMFGNIREGEIWRLFTPCLLHGGFLHILFNMAWAWILLRQVEERLSIWKLLLLVLFIGILSNVAQYLMSGPYFLGFSGVIVGLVAFIWVRQKMAPWEGYPLHRTNVLFITIFILAMAVLEVVSLLTTLIAAKEISANIGNTAHIIGGVCGYLLGRSSFFARGSSK